MKKNTFIKILFSIGILLIFLSIVLTFIAADGKNIIGGVGLPTLIFIFFNYKRGIFGTMAFAGIIVFTASLILAINKRHK